jgi:Uma2 family endonuclease
MQSSVLKIPTDLPHYSYDDYKTWGGEWELIDGIPYSLMPSPTREHQRFSKQFTVQVENMLAGKGCVCEVYYEFDWIVNNETVVRPDAMIVCSQIETKWLMFPPVLILEIASDATYLKDKNVKLRIYEMNKVKFYVMADPEKKRFECYELLDGNYQVKKDKFFNLDDGVKIEIDFGKMW